MIELQTVNRPGEVSREHEAGCVICGRELIYAETSVKQTCGICGQVQESSIVCPGGHFVCDACHRADAVGMMEVLARHSDKQNPIELAREMMALPSVHMHGPEHHVLVPLVLLASLRNLGVEVPEARLQEALLRSGQLPGGICGSWGTCGAAIGAGIGLSVLRGLTALKKEGWAETNRETGEILQHVGAFGGPRCCKRSTYAAILAAVEILERDGVAEFPPEAHEKPVCRDFPRNRQCLKEECGYYPKFLKTGLTLP
ncbi:hypothetical protein CEB3_c32530 [Peptococcaceae bacterium CEB3]|nr:hypothetical protein CEB3_c32530 [Peptococcaceae bacterium CEB3]